MQKDHLSYILCSQELLEKMVPYYREQVSKMESENDISLLNEINKNKLTVIADDFNTAVFPSDQWQIRQLPPEKIDYRIQGTINLRQLVNGIPIPIFLRNTEGIFIGCNPCFVDFMGITEDELVSKTVHQIVPQHEADEYLQRDRELIDQPHIQIYEGKITRKDGETKDVIFRKSLLTDQNEQAVAIVGVIIDISKRKKVEASLWEYRNKLEDMVLERTVHLANINEKLKQEVDLRSRSEKALKASEELLRTVFNSTYDAILLLTPQGHILNMNDKTIEMFGLSPEQSNNLVIWDSLSADVDSSAYLKQKWEKVIQGENQFFEWNACRYSDKSCFESEIYLRKIILENQDTVLANIRDITERKTVEKLLLQEHNKVKVALKNEMLLSTIATILNSSENFFEVIENLTQIIAQTLHLTDVSICPFEKKEQLKILKKSWMYSASDLTPQDKQVLRDIEYQIKANQSVYLISFNDKTEAMRHFFLSRNVLAFAAMPLRVSGKINGMLVFQSDSTLDWTSKHYGVFNTITNIIANAWERHLLHQQRIDSEKKNLETVQLLESSSKLASIGVMAAGITHEINQPLNAIKILADGVAFWNKRNPNILPEMFLGKMDKISQAVNRIDSIVKHMRSFWVRDSHAKDESFTIQDAIHNAVDMIRNQLLSHGVELDIRLCRDSVSLKGDMIHLEQIIINLCVNAMHAMDTLNQTEKKIIIELICENKSAVLMISDNGPGLPEELGDKLFDPFYSTKKPGEGMGLGLAIVKQFVENFSGSIHAENKKEESGAVFRITFS